jgi:protein tyrosine/serine phosphatase
MKMRRVAIILGAVILLLAGGTVGYFEVKGVHVLALITARQTAALPDARPAAWAEALQRPGLPNLHKVTDDLYRGAQPTAEGFEELKKLGIRTVVNLRSRHSDEDVTTVPGLDFEHIAISPFDISTDETAKFLKIVSDKSRAPVYVHCQYGADRTGTLCAIFRVTVQGWSKDEALREMTLGGFGYHEAWEHLLAFIRNLDVDALRRQAGLPAPPDSTNHGN